MEEIKTIYYPIAKEAQELVETPIESSNVKCDKFHILKIIEIEAEKHFSFVDIRRRNSKYDKEVKKFLTSLGYKVSLGALYIHVEWYKTLEL